MDKLISPVFFISAVFNVIVAHHCDSKGILLYEDIACKPLNSGYGHCPTFQCDKFVRSTEYCLVNGEKVPSGTIVPKNLTGRCDVGCFCSNGRVNCVIVDCANFFVIGVTPECLREYDRIDQCCSSGKICPPFYNLATCQVNGKMYREGEIFYPTDACYECICRKGFKGNYEMPFCRRRKCGTQIRFAEKLENYCAPVYKENNILCCPSSWICESEIDVTEPSLLPATYLAPLCKFGTSKIKLGTSLKLNSTKYGRTTEYQCTCSIPPFLTCRIL